MERTLIAWNLPNWLTVLAMAAGGYAAVAAIMQILKRQGLAQ